VGVEPAATAVNACPATVTLLPSTTAPMVTVPLAVPVAGPRATTTGWVEYLLVCSGAEQS